LETLGEYLKSKREARNVTLEEIAEATRIRKTILEAIENDRQDLIPPRVFTQGFLKSYASYLELDESDVVKRYQEALEELETKNDEEEIATTEYVKAHLNDATVLIVDVRSKEEYEGKKGETERKGHIPGALSFEYKKVLAENPEWNELKAVKENNVYAVDANSYFSKPSLRTVTGIEVLANIFHPDVFGDLQLPEDSFRKIN